MVAETCSDNWIKDAMVCSGKCNLILTGFSGKVLIALKKLFFSTIFPDFRHIPVPGLYRLLYIFGSMPGH